jgi:uncharacterized protein (DUF2235 family)
MPKDIVICCDGTGNEINNTISNVLKLYRVLEKDEGQRVYYHPGVGTIGLQSTWGRIKQETSAILQLATGAGLDEDTLAAYRFLCKIYQKDDRVFLFGFSRGAYTVRVLAAFIHVMGLLKPDQIDLAGYAFKAYKSSSSAKNQSSNGKFLDEAWHFGQIAGTYHIPIEFVGVWDTVASIITPLRFYLQTLPYTATNPSVKKFRHAIAIDERRRMFRLNGWKQPQEFHPDRFNASTAINQDTRQVWFAGVHCDVGGGYLEEDSGASKFPLLWMIDQATAAGLRVDRSMVNHLAWGRPREGSNHKYVPPSTTAPLHESLLEWLPKSERYRDWPERKSVLGFYLPLGEPRLIPEGAVIHKSVIDRMGSDPSYRPINMPKTYAVEPGPIPPPLPPNGQNGTSPGPAPSPASV